MIAAAPAPPYLVWYGCSPGLNQHDWSTGFEFGYNSLSENLQANLVFPCLQIKCNITKYMGGMPRNTPQPVCRLATSYVHIGAHEFQYVQNLKIKLFISQVSFSSIKGQTSWWIINVLQLTSLVTMHWCQTPFGCRSIWLRCKVNGGQHQAVSRGPSIQCWSSEIWTFAAGCTASNNQKSYSRRFLGETPHA